MFGSSCGWDKILWSGDKRWEEKQSKRGSDLFYFVGFLLVSHLCFFHTVVVVFVWVWIWKVKIKLDAGRYFIDVVKWMHEEAYSSTTTTVNPFSYPLPLFNSVFKTVSTMESYFMLLKKKGTGWSTSLWMYLCVFSWVCRAAHIYSIYYRRSVTELWVNLTHPQYTHMNHRNDAEWTHSSHSHKTIFSFTWGMTLMRVCWVVPRVCVCVTSVILQVIC